jgi:uncharacterized Zn-finger protein
MKMVNEIYINEITIYCPYCGEPQDGFIDVPRGGKIMCDDCGEVFRIEEFPRYIFDL